MKLEIYGPDGKRKAWTENRECVPPVEHLRQMIKAGYKVLVDGKRWKEGK